MQNKNSINNNDPEIHRLLLEVSKQIDRIGQLLQKRKEYIVSALECYTSDIVKQFEVQINGPEQSKQSDTVDGNVECSTDQEIVDQDEVIDSKQNDKEFKDSVKDLEKQEPLDDMNQFMKEIYDID